MPNLLNRLLRERSFPIFIAGSFFLLLFPLRPLFPETVEPQVSFVKEAFEQGRLAAEENQWSLAGRHFSEAQKADPLRPETLLNLGVAYERSGSPVLAALWFLAFLEASPESSKASQVSEEIRVLTSEIEAKSEELLRLAETAAQSLPAELEEAREEALRALNLARAIAGKNRAEPGFLRIYGEYLAAARDYEGAGALVEEITDPAERNRLLYTLGNYQIFRDERALALRTLRKMSESGEKAALVQSLLVLFTRELNVREAEPLVNEVHEQAHRTKLKELLLLGCLKAGLPAEAERIASEIRDSKIARVVFRKGKEVLDEIRKTHPDPKEPWLRDRDAYQAASALAWLGELELAREACELTGAGDYGKLACALVASEEGKFEETLNRMREMSPSVESDFAVSLFWRLIHQNRLVEATQLSQAVRSNTAKANLLRHLAKIYREKGETQKGAGLAAQSFDLAVASNSSLVLRNLGQQAAEEGNPEWVEGIFRIEWVTHWIALARALERKESLYDLAAYLEKYRSGDFVAFAQGVTQAAGDWASALHYLRGTEKWHGRGENP